MDHPSKWICSGYNEIQKPRRKCVLISYDVLMKLSGYLNFHDFQKAHRGWVEDAINQYRLTVNHIGQKALLSEAILLLKKLKISLRLEPLDEKCGI